MYKTKRKLFPKATNFYLINFYILLFHIFNLAIFCNSISGKIVYLLPLIDIYL